VVVADGSLEPGSLPRLDVDQLVTAPVRAGFAVACNLGLAEARTPYVAIVNDDALIAEDWLTRLVAALDGDPAIAAAQGLNLQLPDRGLIDGTGIGWNHRWQPVQLDHGQRTPSSTEPHEVFGASATAVLYRTEAIRKAAVATGQVFDPALHTYYDDVDLAARLRAAGFRCVSVPAARAFHAGGASSAGHSDWRFRQLYGNRLLILARLLGRSFWLRLPAILRADCADLLRATTSRDPARRRGIVGGWRRGLSQISRFAHRGKPLVPLDELRRFRIERRTETQPA
jgi:GT2 family glycosyltransferase